MIYIIVSLLSITAVIYFAKEGKKKWMKSLGTVFLFSLFSFIISIRQGEFLKDLKTHHNIERREVGKGDYTKKYKIKLDDNDREYSLDINVKEELVTEKEAEEIFRQAQKEIETLIIGKNKALEEIVYDLYLPDSLAGGRVTAEYTFDNSELINWDGTIRTENISKDETTVKVTVDLKCQIHQIVYEFYLNVKRKALSQDESFLEKIEQHIQAENKKIGNKKLSLPQTVDGHSLIWNEEQEDSDIQIFFLGIAGGLCIFVAENSQRKKSNEKRQRQLTEDYPGIVSKFALLLGAGMSVSMSWERIVTVYMKQKKEWKKSIRLGYEEMIITWNEIKDGIGEAKAFERYGYRTDNSAYRRFSALLIQNIQKSSSGMQNILEEEARSSLERRKNIARKYGEEASTKLLFPMLLMLLVVLVILMVPAVMAIQI